MRVLLGVVGLLALGASFLWWLSQGAEDDAPADAPRIEEQGAMSVSREQPASAAPAPVALQPEAGAREAIAPARSQRPGRIVDDATGEAIAGLTVASGRGEAERTTVSDSEGRVDLELPAGAHRFTARLSDGSKVRLVERRLELDQDGEAFELRAKIGPRYLIEVVGPPEARAAKYRVHLVERTLDSRLGARELDRAPDRPLEEGEPRRVRFPSRPQAEEGTTLFLVLRDEGGEWSGSIVPPTLVGEPPEVLPVEVTRFGVLTGTLLESSGAPIHRASVHLTPAGTERWPRIASDWVIERTDEEGRFRFERLEPGEYHLRIAPPYRPMLQQRVQLPAGLLDLGVIEVEGGGEPGVVAGRIESTAGRGGIGAILQLESLDGTGWARSTIAGRPTPLMSLFYGGRASQEAGEESEVEFRFEEVPAGRYRLVVVPWDGRRYEPNVIELEAPTEELVVWREDSLEDVAFGFLVTDAESGAALPEFKARFHTRRWGKEKSFPRRSGEVLGRVAPDGDLSFAVFAEGYAPVWGDESWIAAQSGDPRWVPIALEGGWGAEFTVRDGRDPRRHHHRSASALSIPAPGELPLAGVRVLADGVEVGVSDAEGRARVVLPARPERIAFERAGWTTTPTTTFADGEVLLDCPSPKVWMVPVEPR